METGQGQRMQSTYHKAWQGHFEWCCKEIGADPMSIVPLAVWADAVPYTQRRSFFLLILGFPSLPEADRLPLFMVSTQFLCKRGSCRPPSFIID
eukprot:8852794-Lingulodinium_polyedra.AAC.1